MVLNPCHLALEVLEGRDRRTLSRRGDGEALRCPLHGVVVAHPHRLFGGLPGQQHTVGLGDPQRCASELATTGVGDLAAQCGGHALIAVADTEHRDAQIHERGVDRGRILGVDRRRTTGQDQRGRVLRLDLVDRCRMRDHLGVDPRLTHPPRDQLRILRTEVDDEDRGDVVRGLDRLRICHPSSLGGREHCLYICRLRHTSCIYSNQRRQATLHLPRPSSEMGPW